MRGSSAIDVDDLPRHVGRVVEQKAHRARDVLRAAGALEQGVVDDEVTRLVVETSVSSGHRIGPGATALTRTSGASSTPMRVSPSRPAFAAQYRGKPIPLHTTQIALINAYARPRRQNP